MSCCGRRVKNAATRTAPLKVQPRGGETHALGSPDHPKAKQNREVIAEQLAKAKAQQEEYALNPVEPEVYWSVKTE